MYRNRNVLKIAWITEKRCKQFLVYGTDENDLNVKVMANTTLIANFRDDMIDSMFSHTVILENLDSDTAYYYEFGGETFMSSIYHFRAPKQRRAQLKIIVVSNLGFDDNSKMIVDRISKNIDKDPYLYDALIDLGSDKLLTTSPSEVVRYFEKISKLTSKIPYHGLNRANYMVKEYLGREERENEMYYLQTDTAQIVFLDSDIVFEDQNANKFKEVEQVTLANSIEDTGGWRFLLSDRPFYCSGYENLCKKYSDTMRDVYEKTIINNHFSMVISGGGGQYERTYPVSYFKYDPIIDTTNNRNIKKPIYVTVNGAVSKDFPSRNQWTAVANGATSFGVLTIYDDTEFHYSQYGSDGAMIDEVSVISAVRLKYKILLWVVYGAITTSLIGFLILIYNFDIFFPNKDINPLRRDSIELSDEGISVLHEDGGIELAELPKNLFK